jgi:carboxymethylenebutenolidase
MCHEALTAPIRGGSRMTTEELTLNNGTQEIPSTVYRPDGPGKSPAVLIFHDVNGVNDFYRDLARRFAAEGFLTLLPDFFVRQGPPEEPTREAIKARSDKLDPLTALSDVGVAIETLRSHPNANGKVGIVGFCMGGTFVMLAAARDPLPNAGVAFYGFPAGRTAWPVRPLDEVERVRSPLLLLWGDQDAGVGMDNAQAYRQGLERAGKEFDAVIYPGLPHGYMTFDENARFCSESQDSWKRTLDFLRSRLTSP